jgi:hypothetical protein
VPQKNCPQPSIHDQYYIPNECQTQSRGKALCWFLYNGESLLNNFSSKEVQYNLDYPMQCGPRPTWIIRNGCLAFINYYYKLFTLNFHKKNLLRVFCLQFLVSLLLAMFRRRLSNIRSAGVVSCCSTYHRAVSVAFRPFVCDFFFFNLCLNFITVLPLPIALRNICLPVLTIGLGAAAAEIIYAQSSIHLE